jgi:hypothetical protein
MTNKHEIFLSMKLSGFENITHDQITNLIGFPPSYKHVKGELINPNLILRAEKNGWVLKSACSKHTPFEEQMDSMIDIIGPKIEILRSLSLQCSVEVSCAVYIYYESEESIPSIHLAPRHISVLKEINSEFDLDLYCFPND